MQTLEMGAKLMHTHFDNVHVNGLALHKSCAQIRLLPLSFLEIDHSYTKIRL